MRTQYKNGDEITLTENGCDGCSPAMINGHLCHELGCPDKWRDSTTECKWCGTEFQPQWDGQEFCDDNCAEASA